MAAARFPVAQRLTNRRVNRLDFEYALRRELGEQYELYDVNDATIRQIWQIARDLTLAVDRLAKRNSSPEEPPLTGAEKMELAARVACSFIEVRGGVDALRAVVVGDGAGRLGAIRRWAGRVLLTPQNIERIIRAVLELAVAELRTTGKGENT